MSPGMLLSVSRLLLEIGRPQSHGSEGRENLDRLLRRVFLDVAAVDNASQELGPLTWQDQK